MEIRQVSAAERLDTMFPLHRYAFEATGGDAAAREAAEERVGDYATTLNLVADADGATRACAAAYAMRQNVRGTLLDMAGVAGVASDPAYRRRGYVRALLDQLLRQSRDAGQVVSVLYPFRPSFYGRFGYVGLPQRRRVRLDPAGLPTTEPPGDVELKPLREAFDDFTALVGRVHEQRHGFAIFDETRTRGFRDTEDWVALARDAGGVVQGACAYRISGFGGELEGRDLLSTGPLGRALLLRFFGRHVDQVRTVSVIVGPDEVPELWGTDLLVTTTSEVDYPHRRAPMARVLSVDGLSGLATGSGHVDLEIVDDELIQGVYRLESDGTLQVSGGKEPQARLTAAGFSSLVYGVLDPVDVITRGLGEIEATAIEPLRVLFPRAMPHVFSSF